MTNHFAAMLTFAGFVSLVFAVLMRDSLREQLRFGAMAFAGFIAVALLLGWFMYLFPL